MSYKKAFEGYSTMIPLSESWQFWALMAATFAALTAIFAKIGLDGVNADYATFLRTVVTLCALGTILYFTKKLEIDDICKCTQN